MTTLLPPRRPAGPVPDAGLVLTLAAKEPLAEGVVRLTLTHPAGAPLPAWRPGAHLDLVAAPGLVRQFSLCSDPADRSHWQIAVLREPDGRGGSRWVHEQLHEGSEVRVRGPRNNFPLEPSPRYLFIAGGIGITPLLPMAAEAERQGADWSLLYGGRSRATMAFREELERTYGARVTVRSEDEYGPLDLDRVLGSPEPDTLVYCCGPEGLLQAAERYCAHWPPGALHTERFAPRSPAQHGRDQAPHQDQGQDQDQERAFDVELARSGVTLTVPADSSVLRTVEEAGVQVLSSCREGTCGTCETGVLDGTVDHRDALLTPGERAAHDTMMICVSRAACPRLVLDL